MPQPSQKVATLLLYLISLLGVLPAILIGLEQAGYVPSLINSSLLPLLQSTAAVVTFVLLFIFGAILCVYR